MYFSIHDFRSVVLVPDEAEDMWHAYNLIAVGDRLKSTTIRYVANIVFKLHFCTCICTSQILQFIN